MYCPKCGKELNDEEINFCPACGKNLNDFKQPKIPDPVFHLISDKKIVDECLTSEVNGQKGSRK